MQEKLFEEPKEQQVQEQPDPSPAPFRVGERVRYLGDEPHYVGVRPGEIGTVTANHPGWRGSGKFLWEDESGAPVYEETFHGRSIIDFGRSRILTPAASLARGRYEGENDWSGERRDR